MSPTHSPKQTRWTPGPWELVSLSGYGSPFSIRMPYIATTANVGQTHYGVQSVRRREDALLIAAAPKLYEALEALLEEAEDVFVCMADATGIDRHNLPAPFIQARAALSKAKAPAEGEKL